MPIKSNLLSKPRLVKKLKDFYEYVNKNDGKVGTKTRGIDLNFNNDFAQLPLSTIVVKYVLGADNNTDSVREQIKETNKARNK